ncbi:uncharacterized protein LOC125215704 [Salvia hispanica]|uniref:uncharacterized protein LOC125215704 n=1 Tax=Salvia hispanica TaxID=49212 RepID=UPI00200943BF|nr:uncharacterized protein LOC125215704 [Salvia hispanica]XP_047973173.1 uncharacterized protein LOC125215704 [Salvia hispanica]
MDCGSSLLPYIWCFEALACSNRVEASLLLDLLRKTPQISKDIGKNARERGSLKFLESLSIHGACANSVSSASREKVIIDPSDRCEDVLRQILSEKSLSDLKAAGPEISKWDLKPFIEHQKSNLPRYALKQLKDAILTGSPSIPSYIREQSGLPVGSHAEPQAPAEDGNCYGSSPGAESHTDDGSPLPRDLPDENLVPRKKRSNEGPAEQLCITRVSPVKKNKVSHCDNGRNNKPEEQQRQELNIEEEGGKNEAHDLKTTNDDVNGGLELHMENVDAVEEKSHVSDDNDGNDDGKTDTARKQKALHSLQCTSSQDSLETTNSGAQNLLADASKRYSKEKCSLEKETCVEVMKQNGSAGNGNSQGNSIKDLHVLPHRGTGVLNENFDVAMQNNEDETRENDMKGFHGLTSIHEDIYKDDQNVHRTVRTVGEAEAGVHISSDDDGYQDEEAAISTQKETYLSYHLTCSQNSLATNDGRELHFCMKCHMGGESGQMLSCISPACPLMIHESCLDSDVSFDTRETFYCPFCAYSRSISKYMEVKKSAFLARKDLATFFSLGPQNEPNIQTCKSVGMDGNCLKQNEGLPKSNEPKEINIVEKVLLDLEYEQAGNSKLHADFNPPFGRKTADSTDKLVHSFKTVKQDMEGSRQKSQRLAGCRPKPIAAEAVRNSPSETVASETSGSAKHADVRFKKGVPRPPEKNLPCEHLCSQSSQSNYADDLSEEENEDSGPSKRRLRFQKQKRQNLHPAIPQLKRRKLLWTSEEEDKLKEGVHKHHHTGFNIPWTTILEEGKLTFHPSRTPVDLKDKWRNMCNANSKSKMRVC